MAPHHEGRGENQRAVGDDEVEYVTDENVHVGAFPGKRRPRGQQGFTVRTRHREAGHAAWLPQDEDDRKKQQKTRKAGRPESHSPAECLGNPSAADRPETVGGNG